MSKVVFLLALLAACYTGLEWYSYTPLDQNQTHSMDQWDHDENMQALWWDLRLCFVIAGAAGLRWAYVHNQQERTLEFKEAIRRDFLWDFEQAWAAYVPVIERLRSIANFTRTSRASRRPARCS